MNVSGVIEFEQGEHLGVENLRRYKTGDGSFYFIGSNSDLERAYNNLEYNYERWKGLCKINLKPRYDVHPLMNINRNYGLEIRDGKFAIVTAEKLVENILKW